MPNSPELTDNVTQAQTIIAGFDALDHGIAIWDKEQNLSVSNAAFRQQFQGNGSVLDPGSNYSTFLTSLAASGLLVLAQTAEAWVAEEEKKMLTWQPSQYIFGDGSHFQIERWCLAEGGTITMARDITVEKRSERVLQKAREEADSADKTKSRFLRAANHDLRQPLASLKILIYNCMTAEDEENRAHLLHAMDVSVSIMEDLLGALLNIGQLDAGQVTPRITTFQISTLLERLEVQFGHQANDKGLDFELVPSKLAIVSDRALLERILSNLVGNAIRYTETGGITIECKPDGKAALIEVRDTGCGIAEEHKNAIFDEFFRIADEQVRHKHSLGLGLNIAKRLADVLEHPLSVTSEVGKGSVFSIKVPTGDVWHSDIGEPEINERIGGEFMGLTALVLEDDENLREALAELLERWGIVVYTLNNFDNMADYFDSLEAMPDFIISDYRLYGGAEGTDIVRQAREHIGNQCPAIVVTADTNPELIASIRSDGFPVLIKPVSPPSLRVMMHNVLYEPELVQELRQQNSDPSDS